MNELMQKIRQRTLSPPAMEVTPYVNEILGRYGDRVIGIFMYGSLLSEITATSTSFPDFFVITDGYRRVFKKRSEWLLAYPIPPHIYHLSLGDQSQCKYNLVSYRRFKRECSRRATDIYILGRFGKRVALVYARDQQAQQLLLNCCLEAMKNVSERTLLGINRPLNAVELTLACLNLSYAGETRVEEASQKVPKLFEAEKAFYLDIYPRLLERIAERRRFVYVAEDGLYHAVDKGLRRRIRLFRLRWFLFKSRVRGILRWPKFLLTVDDWVSILLAKIERTQGIKIELTPRERRHPLIYGWKYFFRLLRQGAIGSAKTPQSRK